ncbi:MAG TPA: hypothetical protein VFI61_03130 [Patescibacteria group bacterium]|nr:hypothetical protein [Patescibacteria group bacterium]
MKNIWQKLHRVGDILHLPDFPAWVLGLLALVLILRIPSFFEPYYYGDEMIYVTLGQGVRQGLTLYKDIYDNKPPLLYLTAAIAGNLFWFKAILTFWILFTVAIFYKLSKLLFENEKTQQVATSIFAMLTTIPLLEGNIVNSELFMVAPSILAILILLSKNLNSKKIFLTGMLFGISALFKIPALFDLPVIVFYWIITRDLKNEWKEIFKNTVILGLGFLLPILLTFVWYFFKGALSEYIKAAFLQNVGYLSSFRPGDVQKSFIEKNAPLLIRGLIVLLGSGVLFIFKNKLSKKFILFCVWSLFALFAVTLSERPYPHYLIQTVAPLSFLLAMFFTEKNFEQALVVIPLALTFFVPVYYRFWFYPTATYYQRFINFAIHKTTKGEYFTEFGSTVNRNYKIAEFLTESSKSSDRVFMWDPDSATVYALSHRLPPVKWTIPYHVNDYSNKKDLVGLLKQNPPKFIILTSGNSIVEIRSLLNSRYVLLHQIENADIYTRIDLAR